MPSVECGEESLATLLGQPQAVELPTQLCRIPEPVEIGVDPRSGGRIDDVVELRVHASVLPHDRAVSLQRVFLVIVLRQIERGGGRYVRLDGPAEPRLFLGLRLLGQALLLSAVEEDGRFVLAADTAPRRVVACEEDLEQLLVRDHARVEVELHGLGVVAEVVVCGVELGPAGIADPGPYHSFEAPELGLRAPESAQGEGGRLKGGGGGQIDRGKGR